MWFKAPEISVEPRNHPTCAVIGKRQLLVVGGINTYLNDKDRTPQGLSIFDMTELTWKKDGNYDPNAEEYRTPKVIQDWYNGRNLSELEWTSDEVKHMFLGKSSSSSSTSLPTSASNPSTTTTGTAASATSSPDGKGSSVNTIGPIVGGVVGGVIIVALVLGLSYYYLRARKRKASSRPSEPGLSEDKPGEGEPSSPKTKELPTEPQAREMYVSPEELPTSNQTCELDAESRAGELDINNQVYELSGEHREAIQQSLV